ncbi:MAG: TIGR01212 family radical SAM protein [Clostridia bacterium]|nr:TIGR01212 family radical SAM protein [Clostridia bacterium]
MAKGKVNPFPYSDTNKRYHTFDYYLRQRFGRKCARITLDAGFSCPNIDGISGHGGCIYCTHPTVGAHPPRPLDEQFYERREVESKKWPGSASIVYFNEGTNTYAPIERLRELYEEALSFPDVVGLAVATRADALTPAIVEYLRELDRRTFLVVELGLQSVHDVTAVRINRGHDFACFARAMDALKGLNVCVHLINGLPGENAAMMLDTARIIADLKPMMVKIHMLYISRGTAIARLWERGEVPMLSLEEYVRITADQLELLPPETVIGRITGDGDRASLLAPEWTLKKLVVMNEIDKLLAARDSMQGIKYSIKE